MTREEAENLLIVKDGGDVKSIILAKKLREIQKKYPTFIVIGAVANEYKVEETLPYFGAIATEEGIRAAKEVLEF